MEDARGLQEFDVEFIRESWICSKHLFRHKLVHSQLGGLLSVLNHLITAETDFR